MNQITLPSKEVALSSENPSYLIRLNHDESVIPTNYNVTGIKLEFPPHLVEVRLVIGGSPVVVVFDASMKNALESFPVYVALACYMKVNLEFVYDKEWLEKNETYEYVDEYKTEVVFGEDLVTVYDEDECEYHSGLQVLEKQVLTGNKVRAVIKGATVTIPEVVFQVKEHDSAISFIHVPYREKIKVSTFENDAVHKEMLISKFNLEIIDDTFAFVDSWVVYRNGFANRKYCDTSYTC